MTKKEKSWMLAHYHGDASQREVRRQLQLGRDYNKFYRLFYQALKKQKII